MKADRTILRAQMAFALNGTYLELKDPTTLAGYGITDALNGTYLELKGDAGAAGTHHGPSLNGTYLELKDGMPLRRCTLSYLSMVPIWN